MDWRKIEADLGWRPTVSLDNGLRETVSWYLDNRAWTKLVLAEAN